MPLQIGGWIINVSGFVDGLIIDSVQIDGVISGKIYAGLQIAGFWDEDSQRITFTVSNEAGTSAIQLFEGYMFSNSTPNLTGVPGSVIFTMSGYAEGFIQNATPNRHVFGWYAQIGVD